MWNVRCSPFRLIVGDLFGPDDKAGQRLAAFEALRRSLDTAHAYLASFPGNDIFLALNHHSRGAV